MEVLPDFTLLQPASVADAVRFRRDYPTGHLLAGGTDLVANLRRGLAEPSALIDLSGIAELRDITRDSNGVHIGAGVTLARLAEDSALAEHAPVLAAAATAVAGPSHRETATLGGNLCLDTRCLFYNQSAWWRASNAFCLKYKGTTCHVAPTGTRCHAAYSGDLAPTLMVLGAAVELAGPDGMRRIPLAELYADDGAAHLRLGAGEIVTTIHLPPSDGLRAGYRKARLRGAIDFPLAGVAVALRRDRAVLTEMRVALTGTNSRPFLLAETEALVGGALDEAALRQLDRLVQKQVSPMRTTMAPAHYRRRVAAALARRLADQLFASTDAAQA